MWSIPYVEYLVIGQIPKDLVSVANIILLLITKYQLICWYRLYNVENIIRILTKKFLIHIDIPLMVMKSDFPVWHSRPHINLNTTLYLKD